MMPIQARRVFRLALTTALSLAVAYAMALPLALIAPLMAFILAGIPGPPMGPKSLVGLIAVVIVTLGIGLVLTPAFLEYPASAFLLVALGLLFSNYLTVNRGKGLVGTFLTVGFTMIPAAGTVSFSLGLAVIQGLVVGIAIAIICHWVVYPLFPEDPQAVPPAKPPPVTSDQSMWLALRATLVVLPPFFVCLTNPTMYLPLIMKSVLLGQQSSMVDARAAGRELLGSTFAAGVLAVLFWFGLKLSPNLWMFFLWMLLFGSYLAAKFYGVLETRFPPSYWQNVAVTMLILLGPAVQDSANGKDVYAAFAVRMGLFVAVTLYAWMAVAALEYLRSRRAVRIRPAAAALETV
jgi:hypothetical protein